LRNVFNAYTQRYQRRIEDVIKKELHGDLQRGLLALGGIICNNKSTPILMIYLVQCVQNAPLYVAELLESAMAGLGTNERRLSRVIIRNRGPFMEHVKLAYVQRYGKSLRKRIEVTINTDNMHT
jgi:annexin A7/11